MTNGMQVVFEEPVTNAEMDLAAMLLHIAHTHPDVVEKQRVIKCSEVKFPGTVASRFCNVPATTNMVTVPEDDFVRIVKKLIRAKVVCRMSRGHGKVQVKTTALMPVVLVDGLDPGIMFTEMPQCYFRVVHKNGRTLRQITPKDDMLAFMRKFISEAQE